MAYDTANLGDFFETDGTETGKETNMGVGWTVLGQKCVVTSPCHDKEGRLGKGAEKIEETGNQLGKRYYWVVLREDGEGKGSYRDRRGNIAQS